MTSTNKALSLPEDLMRRYRRCIRFDYYLCALYILSAAIPLSALFKISGAQLFHVTGTLLIISIGIAGIMINRRLLDHRISREKPSYGITIAFVLSRLGLAVWGTIISFQNLFWEVSPTAEPAIPWTHWIKLSLNAFASPPLVYLFFFAAVYRTIYHISVHFYLRGVASTAQCYQSGAGGREDR
jgi:hypothetical protein